MTHEDVSRCPNGKQGSLISWQPAVRSFSPSIRFFDCSDPETRSPTIGHRLHPRRPKREFSCEAPCSTTCSTSGIPYNATDCDELSQWMWQRDAQYPVNAHQRVVLNWGTCMYAFTNHRRSNVTWCDAQWGQIGNDIARPCLTESGAGGTCAGHGFLVEVLSDDGSTDGAPVPYTAAPTSSTYTEVPIPLVTTVSSTFTSGYSQYGAANVPVVPVVIGVLGGVGFLTVLLVCVCLMRRRAERGNMPLASVLCIPTKAGSKPWQASEEVHAMGPKPAKTAYSMKDKFSKHDLSSLGLSQQPTLSKSDSQNTGSRAPTRSSTYTIEFDPFRLLRRALSGRARRQPNPATAL